MKGLSWHGLNADRLSTFEDDLVDFGVYGQVQVLVNCTSAVNVPVCGVTSASGVAIDPFQPMLSTVAGDQILEIVCGRDALRLGSA